MSHPNDTIPGTKREALRQHERLTNLVKELRDSRDKARRRIDKLEYMLYSKYQEAGRLHRDLIALKDLINISGEGLRISQIEQYASWEMIEIAKHLEALPYIDIRHQAPDYTVVERVICEWYEGIHNIIMELTYDNHREKTTITITDLDSKLSVSTPIDWITHRNHPVKAYQTLMSTLHPELTHDDFPTTEAFREHLKGNQ